MNIEKDRVVTIHYDMKDDQGEVLESSGTKHPMAYLHGHDNIFAGIEAALLGKTMGDEIEVTLSPDEAYGERREIPLQRIAIKRLQGARKWRPGMIAVVDTEQGRREVTVVKVGKFNADCDLNHPYAGKSLTFAIKVQGVREASLEELQHGHAHGDGGHQH